MNVDFQSEFEELIKSYEEIKEFVLNHNKDVNVTHYYYVMSSGNNFLKSLEETLSELSEDQEKKDQFLKTLDTFLKKMKDLHSRLSLSNNPEDISIINDINDYTKFLGFSDNDDGLFLKLEHTLNRFQ